MAKFISTIDSHKDKIFSFIEESSLTFGVTFGSILGLTTAASHLSLATEPVKAIQAVIDGAAPGMLVAFAATYAPPVLAKVFYHHAHEEMMTEELLLTTHQDTIGRSAGLIAGIGLALSLTWNAVAATDNKPVNVEPLVTGVQQILTNMGESYGTALDARAPLHTANMYTFDPKIAPRKSSVQPQ